MIAQIEVYDLGFLIRGPISVDWFSALSRLYPGGIVDVVVSRKLGVNMVVASDAAASREWRGRLGIDDDEAHELTTEPEIGITKEKS